MKNNVICILIDSVTWESVGTTRCKVSPTPFMDSLRAEALTASKLYSHGPYTDAATRSLFTGRNCLDDFGYYFKWNTSPLTHHKMFHDEGYETIALSYSYGMWGKNITDYIDKHYYTTGMKFGSEWGGIFEYYHNLVKTRPLDESEYALLTERTKLMFDVWLKYYNDLIRNPQASLAIAECIKDVNLEEAELKLKNEQNKFNASPREYLDNILSEGKEHILHTINNVNIEKVIDGKHLDNIYKENHGLFRKIIWNNFKANWWLNLPSIKRIFHSIKHYSKSKDKFDFEYIKNYIGCLTSMQLMKKRWSKQGWQNTSSSRFQLNLAADKIIPSTRKDKPFYLTFHLEEPHNNLAFFSYDIKDKKLVEEEINMLNNYVKELGTDFKGCLIYYLSLRYIDFCIEEFCNKLKEMGLWDNTTLLLLSDHGSSYTYYPLHNRRVNNYDDECYHIPCLIRHPGFKGYETNNYHYSKDIFPTVFDILGFKQRKEFKGISMLNRNIEPRKYIVNEYMGPGCPDILHRPICFSARDERYIVAYKVGIYEPFDNGELVEVYDLKLDPKGLINRNYSVNRESVQYLLNHIEERFKEIKADVDIFMNDFNNGKIKI